MNELGNTTSVTRGATILRGICGRCPKCGQGKIYTSYLKLNPKCSACGEDFSTIRADDGPTWLTTIITGHLTVPLAIYLAMHDLVPPWMGLSLLLFLTIAMAMVILPRAKGIFINVIWLQRQKRPLGSSKYDHLERVP